MNYELFDKKYVYFDFNDVSKLKGKYGFGSDTFNDLIWRVNENSRTNSWFPCMYSTDTSRPFHLQTGENVRFFYYDPHYEEKLAFKNGEILQYKYKNWRNSASYEGIWNDYTENTMPHFDGSDDRYDWRVKPIEETWWVIFAEDVFLRISMIDNLSNTVFFSGTYEECGKWIDEHKVYVEVLSAYKHGKTIQYKPNRCDFWIDWTLKEYPNINSLERCDWRIKPTTEEDDEMHGYYLSVSKDKVGFKFESTIKPLHNYIYVGDARRCMQIAKNINENFIEKNCKNCNCEEDDCNYCPRLVEFVRGKNTRRMTNRELSEWLSKGNGEMVFNQGELYTTVHHEYDYVKYKADEEVPSNIKIRKWDYDEWEEPLIEE